MTVVLNEQLGLLGAEVGMTLAASRADREQENWTECALDLFRLYAIQKPEGFLTEEVRAWAERLGFEPPPDNRAWGHIARRAVNAGYVEPAGFKKQASATCHGSPKTLWKRRQA